MLLHLCVENIPVGRLCRSAYKEQISKCDNRGWLQIAGTFAEHCSAELAPRKRLLRLPSKRSPGAPRGQPSARHRYPRAAEPLWLTKARKNNIKGVSRVAEAGEGELNARKWVLKAEAILAGKQKNSVPAVVCTKAEWWTWRSYSCAAFLKLEQGAG